jgi:hypothetical protein
MLYIRVTAFLTHLLVLLDVSQRGCSFAESCSKVCCLKEIVVNHFVGSQHDMCRCFFDLTTVVQCTVQWLLIYRFLLQSLSSQGDYGVGGPFL